jgi:hypothetical protein
VHLLFEVSPSAWQIAAFDTGARRRPPGILPGDEILRDAFPSGVRDYWQSAASFHVMSHASVRSLILVLSDQPAGTAVRDRHGGRRQASVVTTGPQRLGRCCGGILLAAHG